MPPPHDVVSTPVDEDNQTVNHTEGIQESLLRLGLHGKHHMK